MNAPVALPADRALGPMMAAMDAEASGCSLTPWPDPVACPYEPAGAAFGWYVFQERVVPPYRSAKIVHLTPGQVARGAISRLDLHRGWLADAFPPASPEAGEDPWDRDQVAAWLRQHCEAAADRQVRIDAAVRCLDAKDAALRAGPAPAPVLPAVDDAIRFAWRAGAGRLGGDRPHLATFIASRDANGRARVAITVTSTGVGGSGNEIGAAQWLTSSEAHALAEVLIGRPINPPA